MVVEWLGGVVGRLVGVVGGSGWWVGEWWLVGGVVGW